MFLHTDAYVQHIFGKIISCALPVFLCARVFRPVCARTREQLRGNIGLGWWLESALQCVFNYVITTEQMLQVTKNLFSPSASVGAMQTRWYGSHIYAPCFVILTEFECQGMTWIRQSLMSHSSSRPSVKQGSNTQIIDLLEYYSIQLHIGKKQSKWILYFKRWEYWTIMNL